MGPKDLASNVKVTQCLTPAVRTADANGTAIDRQGFGSLMFVASLGNSADTLDATNYILVELEESDDNSSFTDVADEDIVTAVTGLNTGTFAKCDDSATEDTLSYKVGYRGNKRYVRPVYNAVGTHTTGTPSEVLAIQGHPCAAPVA